MSDGVVNRPGLKSLFSARVRQDKPARDAAMRRACLEYGYTMAAVGREAGVHYSTVSKVIRGKDENRDAKIVRDDADCDLFLDALREVVTRFGWLC